MVYYGTTAVDHIQRVFAEFKKKYPFMEVADYRSGSVNVFNKIATEARANRYEVDVIDLEPGEVFGIAKAGLIDPYLSPSRKGIAPEFMDRSGLCARRRSRARASILRERLRCNRGGKCDHDARQCSFI